MRINNKKASLFGTPLILLLSFVVIIMVILLFFFLTATKDEVKTVKDAKEIMGTNLFVIGLMRADVLYENSNITLSELISYYNLNHDVRYGNVIRDKINELMRQMYQKDVCWELKTSSWEITDNLKNCEKLSAKYKIYSDLTIPSFDSKSFNVEFETPT